MLLKNKNAVVTGCNRGIGKKFRNFSANGANIFACARTINDDFKRYCKNLENKNKTKIIPVYLDLDDENKIKEAASLITNNIKHV